MAGRGLSNARFAAEAPLKGDPRSAHLVKILQPSQPRIECVLTSIRPYAARRLDELHSSLHSRERTARATNGPKPILSESTGWMSRTGHHLSHGTPLRLSGSLAAPFRGFKGPHSRLWGNRGRSGPIACPCGRRNPRGVHQHHRERRAR